VVQRLNPGIEREPARWVDEELVPVGGDIEAPQRVHETWDDLLRIERVEVHDCNVQSVLNWMGSHGFKLCVEAYRT
jgi:hypothetical protein